MGDQPDARRPRPSPAGYGLTFVLLPSSAARISYGICSRLKLRRARRLSAQSSLLRRGQDDHRESHFTATSLCGGSRSSPASVHFENCSCSWRKFVISQISGAPCLPITMSRLQTQSGPSRLLSHLPSHPWSSIRVSFGRRLAKEQPVDIGAAHTFVKSRRLRTGRRNNAILSRSKLNTRPRSIPLLGVILSAVVSHYQTIMPMFPTLLPRKVRT